MGVKALVLGSALIGTLLSSLVAGAAVSRENQTSHQGGLSLYKSSNEKRSHRDSLATVNNTHQWMKLGRTLVAQPVRSSGLEKNVNIPSRLNQLTLVQGTEIQILQYSETGEFVQIALDEDISFENPGVRGTDPVVVWLRTTDLQEAELALIDIEGLEFLADLGIIVVDEDGGYAETDNAAQGGGRVRRRGRGGMTYCLRDVRLTAVRWTKKVPQGIPYAAIAYPRYKALGWKPVEYSSSVPLGTACFFGGGRSCGKARCGHAAIKISSKAWKGAGVRPTPFMNSTGPGRTKLVLQGCLVPPKG